ncbi:hypothetical protein CA267_006520 [Alteromonas pelagimontana]|uniref:ATPase BadF/BadG/BcrA/BcrD type domain-containing protein n=1 Tax=Alteromonas pelagimontana TaxID=1858656 RepID=A0A6M4MB77_9ALTE|nr:BadF/BadG/BcrA/BcrD ATPase family protein [Alteromonas pelagimontana]QJR80451.1 hypothetical protein CA267_006520 [Alteromonas pelagimontana]
MQSNITYFVGIDGGGTKCRAEVFDENGLSLGAGVSGPANVARQGDTARNSILQAVTLALTNAGLDAKTELANSAVGAGLAGANLPSAKAALKNWRHPFAGFSFTSDLHAAMLGAHGGSNGAVLVVGTGSCAAALVESQLYQYGGHGFTIGDKGSGAWMGRQAAIHTLEALDGVAPRGALCEAVCAHYQTNSTIKLVDRLNHAPPADFGELSPAVISLAEQGDKVASAIVITGTDYLTAIARKALAQSPGKLVLVGGVAGAIVPWLAKDVADAIVSAKYGPEWGAFYYQQSLFQEA